MAKKYKTHIPGNDRNPDNTLDYINACNYYGRSHKRRNYPAFYKTCDNCKNTLKWVGQRKKKYKKEVSSEDSDSCIEQKEKDTLDEKNKKQKKKQKTQQKQKQNKKTGLNHWTATIKVNYLKMNFKLNSGADINVQPNKQTKKKTLSAVGIKENFSHTPSL